MPTLHKLCYEFTHAHGCHIAKLNGAVVHGMVACLGPAAAAMQALPGKQDCLHPAGCISLTCYWTWYVC